jgi:hypothetical protein
MSKATPMLVGPAATTPATDRFPSKLRHANASYQAKYEISSAGFTSILRRVPEAPVQPQTPDAATGIERVFGAKRWSD